MTGPARELYAALIEELTTRATAEQKASAEAYFKGAVPFLGVKMPVVDEVFKAAKVQRAALTLDERLSLARTLFDQDPFEVRHLGILMLAADVKRLPDGWLVDLEPLLERRCTNWGTADAFAGRVLRYRLTQDRDRARITGWSRAESPWLRRMACVTFVNEAHKGVHADEIRAVVAGALALDHRFSQLGAGWLLRNRWLAAPAEVEAFLLANRGRMRREALRYAVEKMPKGLQGELLG